MADAILVTTRLMCQVPRPAQLEPVFLLIQQQQTRKLRERVVKGRCQLRRRFRKPLKRHVQRYFFVPRIHKRDRKSTRLNSSHLGISYAVFCLKKKNKKKQKT